LKIKPRIGAKDFGAAVWLSPTLVLGFEVARASGRWTTRKRRVSGLRLLWDWWEQRRPWG